MTRNQTRRGKGKQARSPARTQNRRGLYVMASLLALALISGGIVLFSRGQGAKLVTPEVIAAEIIPEEGDATSYGIALSLDNTQRFIDHHNTVVLAPEQQDIMDRALHPLKAPCCDDNSMATCCCPCNLAKSVWGLSAYLIVEHDYDARQVRESAEQWLRFIHPDYHVMQELSNRGVDPGGFGLSYEAPCYSGYCELPFVDGGCGGMAELKQ